jgi:hypothetical protein
MQQLQETIGGVARQMLDNFTKEEERDGLQFWKLREDVEWTHHLVMTACGDKMSSPQAHEAVFKVLIEISLAENREQAEEFLNDIEPYQNLAELTAWLNGSQQNVEFVTAVLQRGNPSSGMEVLAKAHKLYLQDIGRQIIDALQGYVVENVYAEKPLN